MRNFLPIKTRVYKNPSNGELVSHVFLVNDENDPQTVKLLDAGGNLTHQMANFDLTDIYDEQGTQSYKAKESVIFSTYVLFGDNKWSKKELYIIQTEFTEKEQKKIRETENKHTSHSMKLNTLVVPLKENTNFPNTIVEDSSMLQEKISTIKSTSLIGGNKRGYWMLVADDTGHVHKYNQSDRSIGSSKVCEDSAVMDLRSYGDNVIYFCENSIGKFVPE